MVEKIGHYKVVSKLGRGGMGVVYKAHEESLNRYVAIKVLGEHLVEDDVFLSRFVREAQSAASLSHPNIVQIFYIGEDAGTNYFVMEYVQGKAVDALINEQGRIESKLAGRIILDAANGLAAAHDRGVIHRDIKPANLMLDQLGNVKIADFGLALPAKAETKLTATGMLMGTPGYLAPEQCRGEEADHRTDIYALGVSLYEMLTGRAPFKSESPILLIRQILDEEPPDVASINPEVDAHIVAILSRMIEKDRDQRYQNAHELVDDLEEYLAGQSSRASRQKLAALVGAGVGAAGADDAPTAVISEPPTEPDPTAVVSPAPASSAVSADELGTATTDVRPEAASPPPPPHPSATGESSGAPAAETSPNLQAEKRRKGSWFPLIAAVIILLLVAGGALGAFVLNRLLDREPAEEIATLEGEGSTSALGDTALGIIPGEEPDERLSPTDETENEDTADVATDARPQVVETATERASVTTPPVNSPAVRPEATNPVREEPSAAAAPSELRGAAIVVVGDRQLAPEVAAKMTERLSRTGLTVYDAFSLPGTERLVRSDAPTSRLIEAMKDEGLRAMILVRIEPTGERELNYMGRTQTAYSSRVSVDVYDVASGRPVGSTASESIEYTALSREREAEKIVRKLTLAIAQRLRR